jgi:hypothetical protein
VDQLIKKIQAKGLTVVDSWTRSMVLGRIAGPVFWAIAAILHFGFGIIIDEASAQYWISFISDLIAWGCAGWGTIAPVLSKLRQKSVAAP